MYFTIILPVYKRPDTVLSAIQSVLAQECQDWQLIVIDDGHTVWDRLRFYADDRITYIDSAHHGVAKARNLAARYAKGTYITFLDSDDLYRPDHLSTHKQYLEQNKLDVLWGGVKVVGDNTLPDIEHPGQQINVEECKLSGTLFVKTTLFNKVGGFPNVPYAEDYHLFQTLKQHGTVGRFPLPTYVYIRSEDSITKNYKE